jgi:hypothetical protein
MDGDVRLTGALSRNAAPPSAYDQSLPRRHSHRPRGLVLQNGRWVDPRAGNAIERDDLA